eukprot:m.143097 g.143097  ORF g.143097 m.143097 type:complete len:665 (-) comp17157_c0_seq1:28-2022(-)
MAGNRESWETALMLVGYFSFLGIAAYVYWRTSPSYRLQQQKKALGHETTSLLSMCVACIMGPARRTRWEAENKYYRTMEYGEPDDGWESLGSHRPWMDLPRGDEAERRHQRAQAVAQSKTLILNELMDEIVHWGVTTFLEDLKSDHRRLERTETLQRRLQQQRVADSVALAQRQYEFDQARESEDVAQLLAEEEANLSEDNWSDELDDVLDDAASTDGVVLNSHVLGADTAATAGGIGAWAGAVHLSDHEETATDSRHAGAGITHLLGPADIRLLPTQVKTPSSFSPEFRTIPMFPNGQTDVSVESLPYTRSEATAFTRETLVKLQPTWGQAGSHFIHANYVARADGEGSPYIVTQFPLQEAEAPGKRSTIEHFWRMVWQESCAGGLLLIGRHETQGTLWPDRTGQHVMHGSVCVTLQEEEARDNYLVLTLRLDNQGETRSFTQVVFPEWPSDGVPASASAVLDLVGFVDKLHGSVAGSIVLLDGAAGLGSVGTWLAIDYCRYQHNEGIGVDVMKTVHELRQMRGGMVQTVEEYAFVHQAVYVHSLSSGQRGKAPPAYQRTPKFQGDDEDKIDSSPRKASTFTPMDYDAALKTATTRAPGMPPPPPPGLAKDRPMSAPAPAPGGFMYAGGEGLPRVLPPSFDEDEIMGAGDWGLGHMGHLKPSH